MEPKHVFFIFILVFAIASCDKDPGEGGQASIQGKLWVEDWNGNCTVLLDTFYGIDIPVFIIAGDDPSYFERIRTGPGGVYWFPYLRTGEYTVYAISDECGVPGGEVPVEVEVEITERKQKVVLDDLVIKQ